MAIEKLTENVEIVQTLSTYPNQEEGLSAEELKAKFDQGAKIIKDYLNETVVPAVNDALDKPGTPGPKGEEGYSPQVRVAQVGGGHRVEIDHRDDTQGGALVTETFYVMDGVDGVTPELDDTLSLAGRAADAAAVGAALKKPPFSSAVSYDPQNLTPAQKAQARDNIGALDHYHTKREDVVLPDFTEDYTFSDHIFEQYDALMKEHPGKVKKLVWIDTTKFWSAEWEDYEPADGAFVNYLYVISTDEYNIDGYNGGDDSDDDGYEDYLDRDIKKKKYLILSGIHGGERKAVLSAYRFIRDALRGHNVPAGFLESSVIHVLPVGNPDGINAFTRTNGNDVAGVDINRNFDWNWGEIDEDADYYPGTSAASEKETKAIVNWLNANKDAELFIDCHNSIPTNEVVSLMGLADDEGTDRAKKIALRGLDRIIPYWRDVIGYRAHESRPDGTVSPPIYSYSTSMPVNGAAVYYAADVVGIPSFALEMSTMQNGNFSDWYENQHLITPETIAAGAEVIGNILIEFYKDTSEVVDMTEVNSKLDQLIGSVNSGFRVVSGTMVVGADMDASSSSKITVNIPCPNGAKLVVLEPDSATKAAIKARTDKNYILNISAHFSNALTEGANAVANAWVGKSGTVGQTGANATNDNGVAIPNLTLSMVSGTYNWTACYWNDTEATPAWTGGDY